MNPWNFWLKRLLLLNKRLFYRPSYILLLLMVPVMVFTLRTWAGSETGFATIGICENGMEDEATRELFDTFVKKQDHMQFLSYEDAETATEAVAKGEIDAAWIVQEPLSSVMESVQTGTIGNRINGRIFLHIVLREKTVNLLFASELLNCAIYRYTSYAAYAGEVQAHTVGERTEKELRDLYESRVYEKTFLISSYLDENKDGSAKEGEKDISLLVAPLRGMLGVWLFLLGLIGALYYEADEKKGLFVWWKGNALLREAGYILQILLNGGVVYLIALVAIGVFTDPGREITALCLFIVASALSAMLLRRICRSGKVLAMLIPLIVIANLVFCPVFLTVRLIPRIKYLFPLYHYMNCLYDSFYLRSMVIYTLIGAGLLIVGQVRGTKMGFRFSKRVI
ncbi:MAG: hypothetical protein K6A92_07965 [Lachnospiraceae bacterium]|nr:hypothetical protein [Lachnospiraceae bacterium]